MADRYDKDQQVIKEPPHPQVTTTAWALDEAEVDALAEQVGDDSIGISLHDLDLHLGMSLLERGEHVRQIVLSHGRAGSQAEATAQNAVILADFGHHLILHPRDLPGVFKENHSSLRQGNT